MKQTVAAKACKRKEAPEGSASTAAGAPSKKIRAPPKTKGKQPAAKVEWPDYFHSLFKVFKALNTVLAFCSSRKHLATTFPVIRTSVENILRQPLELSQVAELKALLPDLVNFAYTTRDELRINSEGASAGSGSGRARSPDFGAFAQKAAQHRQQLEEGEHVLMLDFNDTSRGKKPTTSGFASALPPALTPAAMKKLVEKRNERFSMAVNELLLATPLSEDPVALLQGAARDHIPVNPGHDSTPDFALTEGKEGAVPESKDRPTIEEVIAEMEKQTWYKNQIIERRIFDAKEGRIGTLDTPLSKTIQHALKASRNIDNLYVHQASAINALAQGTHVIVSTSTASGKSVIYQVPMLRFLEADPSSTAIFVYPTKALAQDQKAALEQLIAACPGLENIQVATYDGDTPMEIRAGIRETASVIFTNFDMVHASILPHEDVWRRFLKNLKLVAVDELHYYSALFGSHVAQVIRRLRRICAAVGNRHSLFVSCSATIARPFEHMQNIFGVDNIKEITDDAAPSGRKDFLIWDRPFIDEMDPNLGRRGAMAEATGLMRYLMKRGVRVILFCKIRKTCEHAMKMLRTDLSAEGRLDVLERVMSYRGGYSPQDRRKIERQAFDGNLLGIVATNALELGVDIGVLDAVLMLGFPVSIASFRQQAGRAGRRARDALAVLVADDYPITQHYVNNPDELFDKPTRDLVIDLESKIILESHLQCAAHEMPLCEEDEKYFGPLTKELCKERLTRDKDGWYHPHPKFLPYPSRHVSLRGAEEEKYCAIDVTKLGQPNGLAHILEEVEISRAIFELFEGAIFIHQGLTFLVREVSHDAKLARLVRSDVSWTTEPRDFTDIDPVKTHRIREIKDSPHRAYYGRVDLRTIVFGYFKMRNKQILDAVDLDAAPWERETTGMWIDIPKNILQLMNEKGINAAEAIHAAQHAFLNRFALAADLKTECKPPEKEYAAKESKRKRPARLIFYDPAGKTGSTSVKAFDHTSDILAQTLEAVESCPCDAGCARCVESPSCKEGNLVSSKLGALVVLQGILGIEINPDDIPDQDVGPGFTQVTIVEAQGVGAVEGIHVETS